MAAQIAKGMSGDVPDEFQSTFAYLLEEVCQAEENSTERVRRANRARAWAADAVSKAERMRIVDDEWSRLVGAVQGDLSTGIARTDALVNFLDQAGGLANPPTPQDRWGVWQACAIGGEKITHEFGSDRFAGLATQAGAVATETVSSAAPKPVRAVLSVLSGVLRVANFAVSPATASRSTALVMALVTVLTGLGLAISVAGVYWLPLVIACAAWWIGVLIAEILVRQWRLALGSAAVAGLGLGAVAVGRHWSHVVVELIGMLLVAVAGILAGLFGQRIDDKTRAVNSGGRSQHRLSRKRQA